LAWQAVYREGPLRQVRWGGDETALLLYNPHTTLVQDAPSAECFTVKDGRIVHSLLVFDRTPFDAARRATT